MGMTAREFIDAQVPLRLVPITVPGGGKLYVKELTPDETDKLSDADRKFKAKAGEKYGKKGTIRRLHYSLAYGISLTVYDPATNKPLFGMADLEGIAAKPLSYLRDMHRKINNAILGIPDDEAEDDPNG